ncbi:MAG: PH domain-containing protein [Candidatus Paceibacterota bacterium]
MIELHANEEIRLVVRKHWFVLAEKIAFLFLMLFLPLLLFFAVRFVVGYAGEEVAGNLSRMFDGGLMFFLSLLWLFFIWIWGFVMWTDYYLDIWVVTNKRVFDIEQRGFFQREVSIFRMDRVQDITTNVRGIIQTFFNFGEIHVQTAGSDREFIMYGAPAPTSLKEVISSLQDKRQNPVDYEAQDNQGL